MKLFVRGNDKVGNALVWNIPVFKTCPGSTALCRSVCYGDWGGNRWPTGKHKHAANYEASLREDFPALALAELRVARTRLCRVHSVGDFYDRQYISKWVEIATAAPEWTFWAYTRSWRVPDLLPELERLAALPHFWLWLSADRQTGTPPDIPRTRVAWMQAPDDDLTHRRIHLVFPLKDEDRRPVKRVGLALVCPHYNGTPEDKVPTCDECRYCFR